MTLVVLTLSGWSPTAENRSTKGETMGEVLLLRRYLDYPVLLRLDYFDRQTSTTKVEVGVENRFYVIEYLSIIRETQG